MHGRNTSVLLIGQGITEPQLSRVLPSLRTANPTLMVIGAAPLANGLAPWVDDVVQTQDEYDSARTTGATSASPVARPLARSMAIACISLLALVFLWWFITAAFKLPAYLLPSPRAVSNAFFDQPARFLNHLGITAIEAIVGFMFGNILGIALAILLTRYVSLRGFSLPVLISLQAIPIVAFAPLLGVWLGTGFVSKIAMATIICFFPMVVNTMQAFSNVDKEYKELFFMYRSNFRTTLMRLLFPASLPAILAALRISAGLAVVGAIVAEMTGADKGLGYLILNGAYRLETDILFVAMVLSAALGVCFYQIPKIISWLLPAHILGAAAHT